MPKAYRLFLVLSPAAACSDYAVTGTNKTVGEPQVCDEGDAPTASYLEPDPACLREPTIGTWNPTVEWQWYENPFQPGYDDIMSTPAIGNLNDDNGDGAINENDIPDVVFTSFSGGAYTSPGALTAISGDGSGTLWSVLPGIYASAGVALGDLDADGVPEVCTGGTQYAVVCVDNTGALKWAAGSEVSYVGGPAIADLDGNGMAEVIFGREVFRHDGTPVFVGTGGTGGSQKFSFAVNMDTEPDLEIVAGNTIYKRDGTILWQSADPDGIPAVGDFDGDGLPEVVTIVSGYVYLTSNTGTRIWATAVPGGGGGPPTVDDFDADGEPEIGVAGAYYYSVIETDGSVRWSMPVQDYSSSVTGSSVFDFEGDGAAEVVYADEVTLWVYDGSTGTVEMALDGHASGTLYEYPLIADVDNDGSSEIILGSNNYAYSGWNGITVIGDPSGTWAPSRPVWNQFAYHITNVNDDLSIPATQTNNWLSWNNFRAGGSIAGPSSWLPDLRAGAVSTCTDSCESGLATAWVTVENIGLAAADPALVEILQQDGVVLYTLTTERIEAGETAILGPLEFTRPEWTAALRVRVDGSKLVEECDEGNNEGEGPGWPCG